MQLSRRILPLVGHECTWHLLRTHRNGAEP